MNQSKSEMASTYEQETLNTKSFLSAFALFLLIGSPIGAGIWCASTAYLTNTTANEVFDATMHAIFGP